MSNKILDIATIKESMRVTNVTSSFSSDSKNNGIKSSSFVSYSVKCKDDEGWSLEEARIVEAILADRVSKDLYADMGARQQAPLDVIRQHQQILDDRYSRLKESLLSKGNREDLDVKALIQAVEDSCAG